VLFVCITQVAFDAESLEQAYPLPPLYNPASESSRPPASFCGFLNQTEISRAYVAADCLVLPSDYGETWGLVVNEALATGLPCLVSDACGCAEELAGEIGPFGLSNISMLASKLLDLARLANQPGKPPTIAETVGSVVRAYRESFATAETGGFDERASILR
jgi:glycosyltransferase involved in cell wall biosynthesis